MPKSKLFCSKNALSYYLSHFLTQMDSALISVGIPTLSYSLLVNYGYDLKEVSSVFLLIPLNSIGKLIGGFFYGLVVSYLGVFKAIVMCLFLTGLMALGLSLSLFAWQTSHIPAIIPLAFFFMLKSSIQSEKAFNLLSVIDSRSHDLQPSIYLYQLFSLLAVLSTGLFFYFFEPVLNVKFLGNAYAIFGLLFVFLGLIRLSCYQEKIPEKIDLKNYVNMIIKNKNLLIFCAIIFGIDQFSYQAAVNLSTTFFFHQNACLIPISLLNALFILLEILLLPFVSKWMESKAKTLFFIEMIPFVVSSILVCLFFCQMAPFELFIAIRVILIILGLSYSLLMMSFLKNFLPKEGFYAIFISKAIGSIAIASPIVQLTLFTFSKNYLIAPLFLTLSVLFLIFRRYLNNYYKNNLIIN